MNKEQFGRAYQRAAEFINNTKPVVPSIKGWAFALIAFHESEMDFNRGRVLGSPCGPYEVTVGEQWKKFRKDHLFTQSKLANLLGISTRTVQLIEKGSHPRASTQLKFETLRKKHGGEGSGREAGWK